MRNPCVIIAELGINHNGDAVLAEEMLRAAAKAGADCVKFHSYKAEDVMTADTPLAEYMKNDETANSFLDMARRFELSQQETGGLKEMAEAAGVEFLSSPFDIPSTYFLADLGVKRLKLPSGELVNPFILDAAAKTGLPLIISTGMADMDEVCWAVDYLKSLKSGPITLLHCLSQYPAEFKYVNLQAMQTMMGTFDCGIGFSDHTPGIEASVAAVAMGACMIEKHFTLDRSLPGPDQAASLEPEEFATMVQAIRNIEAAMGTGVKEPAAPELINRDIVRKSLVAALDIPAGTRISKDMLTAKRPGTGIPARDLARVIGRKASTTIRQNKMLSGEDLDE